MDYTAENAANIEKKWQDFWRESKTHEPLADTSLPKKYILSMFPYPSGDIHMGHVRNYCIGDAMARYYRKQGFNVLHPIGFDAFGMPAENAAIKNGAHPKKWTYANIDEMNRELDALGLSFSKEREFATCDAGYTKWEQKIFIDMWKKGLVYRKKAVLNWCPNDQTVLANEQVENGKCWRCETPVEQKEMEQYYIRITDYAQSLLDDLDKLEGKWPDRVLTMQRNWIGKSCGLQFGFSFDGESVALLSEEEREALGQNLEVFTTRPDTIFGVTYCALAPEHPAVKILLPHLSASKQEQIKKMQNTPARERLTSKKEGVELGFCVIHPLSGEKIPLWVANFVLMDYGVGAVMGVPAHDERDFEFATNYGIGIKQVLEGEGPPLVDEGVLQNSGEFSGLESPKAREAIIAHFENQKLGKAVTNFKLKDWGISRQRYWGAPIPLLHCAKCGTLPQEESKLPITLPEDALIDGEGNPLEKHPTWKHDTCPKCGGEARKETDTMDTFFQSSWYFLRYATPRELWDKGAFDAQSVKYWLEVDEYIGGIEHAILHLLYARFFTKVLRDLGYLELDEPFAHLLTQGMVTKDGVKMSKSKGNVVPPRSIIDKFGADTARLFMLFAAPPLNSLEWIDNGVVGAYGFIKRFYTRAENAKKTQSLPRIDTQNLSQEEKFARKKVYEALLKSNETFEKRQAGYPFNTLIAACMEALNALNAQTNSEIWTEGYFILANVLEPMIPHVCWELSDTLFARKNLAPIAVDYSALESNSVCLGITINGKRRAEIEVAKDASNEEILRLARESVAKWLEGSTTLKEIIVPNKLVNFVVK